MRKWEKKRLDKVLSKFEHDTPTHGEHGYYYDDYLSYKEKKGFELLVSDSYTHYTKKISIDTVESLLKDFGEYNE